MVQRVEVETPETSPPAAPSTRERILEAAADVFAERGYEGAAVSDIARRAGFTTGAIYGHFRDKAELLLEVIRTALEAQQETAVSATRAPAGGNAAGRFATLAAEVLGSGTATRRALILEAHVAARRDPAVGELLRAFQSARLDTLTALVEDGQAAGRIDGSVDAATVATLFLAVPLGIVLIEAAGLALPPVARWRVVAESMAAALLPQDGARAPG